jgi:hypothetical protein
MPILIKSLEIKTLDVASMVSLLKSFKIKTLDGAPPNKIK